MNTPEKIIFQLPQYVQIEEFDILIKEEIGHGGFGSVYLVEYEGDNYALKLYRMWEILPEERNDILKRIYQEYRISDKIDSPHVVKILTYQELLGNPVLIMEYCESGSLRNTIGLKLSFREIAKVVHDICRGLKVMHHEGIVHRDIKPENILLKQQCYCITDFGISANLQGRITQTDIRGKAKQVFATAAYSPPEQANGAIAFKSTGPTNDIYALGVLLYELLTGGKLPYGTFENYEIDPLQYEVKKKKGNWDRQSLAQLQTDSLWIFIIDKCLRPKPSDRFQSVEEILDLLISEKVFDKKNISAVIEKSKGWYLEVIEGKQDGLIFYISKLIKHKNKNQLTIGRLDRDLNEKNDILLNEGDEILISRYHATLEMFTDTWGNEEWYIRDGQWFDLNGKTEWYPSTNGTFVNYKSIGREGICLSDGDIIKVGKIILEVNKMDY